MSERLTIRERLALLLQAEGFRVEYHQLDTQQGDYRKNRWDLARWFADCIYRDGLIPVHIASWCTMTECVRNGISYFDADGYWEICANDSKTEHQIRKEG